jgi:hypothetical protein
MILAALWGRRSLWLIPFGFVAGAFVSCIALFMLASSMRIIGRIFGALVWRWVERRRSLSQDGQRAAQRESVQRSSDES